MAAIDRFYDAPKGPQVQPDVEFPRNARYNISSSPDMFGGLIAKGLSDLGQQLTKTSEFYSQTAALQAINNADSEKLALLHGKPGAMVPGPDGTLVPDTGLMGLSGQAAMDRWHEVQPQFQEIDQRHMAGLSPEAQNEYMRGTQRANNYYTSQGAEHYDRESKNWALTQQADGAKTSLNNITANPNDETAYNNFAADIFHHYVSAEQVNGNLPMDRQYGLVGPDQGLNAGQLAVLNQVRAKASSDARLAQLESIGVHDPVRAAAMADQYKGELGAARYSEIGTRMRSRSEDQRGSAAADSAVTTAMAGGGTHAPPGSQARVAQTIYDGLVGRGWGAPQAAAIVGNMKQESEFNPAAPNPKEGGIGLLQWRLERRVELERFANFRGTSPTDLNTQLDFIRYEMNGSESPNARAFLNARTVEEANHALHAYIRYGDNSEPTRLAYSEAVAAGKFGNLRGAVPQSAVAGGASSSAPPVGVPQISPASFTGQDQSAQTPPPAAAPAPAQPPPEPEKPTTEELRAAAYSALPPDLNDRERVIAERRIDQQLMAYAIQEGATRKAEEERKKKADNAVYDLINQGKYPEAMQAAISAQNGGYITPKELHVYKDVIAQDMNQAENQKGLSANYSKVFNDLLSYKVNDNASIMALQSAGDITIKDRKQLVEDLKQRDSAEEGEGFLLRRNAAIAAGKRAVNFEVDYGNVKVPDPKGSVYESKFLNAFFAEFNKWKKGGEKGDFPYMDPEKAVELAKAQRPPEEMERDRLDAQNLVSGTTGTPPERLPMPQGFTPAQHPAWTTVVGSPPFLPDGKRMITDVWATAVTNLVTGVVNGDPKDVSQTIANFDRKFRTQAEGILSLLGVKPHGGKAEEAPASAAAAPAPEPAAAPSVAPSAPSAPGTPPPAGWLPPGQSQYQSPVFGAPSPERVKEIQENLHKEPEKAPVTVRPVAPGGNRSPKPRGKTVTGHPVEPKVKGEELRQRLNEEQR